MYALDKPMLPCPLAIWAFDLDGNLVNKRLCFSKFTNASQLYSCCGRDSEKAHCDIFGNIFWYLVNVIYFAYF